MSIESQFASHDASTMAQAGAVPRSGSRSGRIVRRLASGLNAAAIGMLLSSSLMAQESTTTTTVVTSGRSYLVEWAIVAVLCGLAVFAVCRSSRRS